MKTAFALLLLLAATITGLAQSHTQHEQWWKHLPAQDSRAWSDEALRLMRLGAAPEAMAVLREAEQRFSKDLQLRQEAAEIAAFEEKSPERLQRLLTLYSEAPSLRDQLRHARLIGANAATTDDFDRILHEWGAQPPDVIHWLRLAALHAGAGDEKRQDECIREAAKLPSQQVDTLLELARYQEESLLFDSMHATLESAVKLDTGTRARRWLAADELTWGSVERGLRLYEQSQPESAWEAEDVLRVAGALLVCNEWQRMLTLLQQQCAAHPGDFRLLTMLAITQEEEGLVHEAVHTWLELLDMKKADRSLPRRLSIPAWSHVPLPRDTYIWLYIAGVISDAYTYRYRIESRAKGQMYPWTDDHTLPRSLDELPLHAFTHLRSLVHLLTPKEQEALHVRLHGLGFPDAKDLLFVPIEEYRPRVDGTYLRKHASNVALHASWYLDQDQFQGAGGMTSRIIYYFPGDEPTPERLRHCFELFAPDYPELALNAAAHTSKSEQTLQKLPGVISRLGFASPGTLADLARLPKADIIRSAIAERITRWLEEDRIPVRSEKGLSELASQVKEAHPKLAALLGAAQARPGWASVNAAGTMFFNNYRTSPGWGSRPRSSRREPFRSKNAHDQIHASREVALVSRSTVDKHLQNKNKPAAAEELRRYLAFAADSWLSFSPADGAFVGLHFDYEPLSREPALIEDAITRYAGTADAAHRGAIFEMRGRCDEATSAYETAYQEGNRHPHLLRRLAVMRTRKDVSAGLALMESIPPSELPLCLQALSTQCGAGNGAVNSPEARLASIHLLTAWLERRHTARKPLPQTHWLDGGLLGCSSGDQYAKTFVGLIPLSYESGNPYPEDFRKAFHGLRAAYLKFPELAVTGFTLGMTAAWANGDDLEPFYQEALRLLQDHRITDRKSPDIIRVHLFTAEKAHPPHLHPAVFATQHAMLTKAADSFEKEVLPLVLDAYGSKQEPILRHFAAMCASEEKDFSTAAQLWLQSPDDSHPSRAFFPEGKHRQIILWWLAKKKGLTKSIEHLVKDVQR